jgi:hypothetical protein
MNETSSYGTVRSRRPDVSYAQIEEAAVALLATGTRPTIDGVREALKGGSPRTLLNGLQRFWKELAGRISGVPDSRRRLPAEVAELADQLWQRALGLAIDAAEGSDESIRAELAQLRTDAELRGHALAQREIEIDALVRSRERTIRELEEHLRAAMSMINKREATISSLEARLAASLSETEGYRQRLAAVVTRAVAGRHRSMLAAKAVSRRPTYTGTRRPKKARPAPRPVVAAGGSSRAGASPRNIRDGTKR